MLSKIKSWALAALGVIAGVLYILFQRRGSQRDKARRDAEQAERNQQATEQQRDTERRVSQSVNEQRKRNEQHEAETNAKPKTERRSGDFGSSDRL